MFINLWQTRNIKHLFNLKNKSRHKSNVIYHAECTCGETYIGEIKRNFAVRKAEHENKSHNSESARHLAKHPTHAYTRGIAFMEENNTCRGPAKYLPKGNFKQASTLFHCETISLWNITLSNETNSCVNFHHLPLMSITFWFLELQIHFSFL